MDLIRHFSAFPSSAFLLFVLCISGGAVVLIAIFMKHGWLASLLFAVIVGALAVLLMSSTAYGFEGMGQVERPSVEGMPGCWMR
ncbi:hypothetical protein ACFWP0_14325 [Achromobacter sp. NPDC058515]|uniref:hypothetical protein n=1 Tax=Achromobacter sp. NPDC058515 TaxID=3346533 RepID=UPI00366A3188